VGQRGVCDEINNCICCRKRYGCGAWNNFRTQNQKTSTETLEELIGSAEHGQAAVRESAGQAIRVADHAKDQIQRVKEAVDTGGPRPSGSEELYRFIASLQAITARL